MANCKWGGHLVGKCSDYLDSSYEWKRHVFNSWYHHGYSGLIPSSDDFMSLDKFIDAMKNDPLWTSFTLNPSLYEFDKDIKGRPLGLVEFSSKTVSIVPRVVNQNEMYNRTRASRSASSSKTIVWASECRKEPCEAISPDGIVYKADSAVECWGLVGFGSAASFKNAASRSYNYPIKKGVYKGWIIRKI